MRFHVDAIFRGRDRLSRPIGKMQSRLQRFSRTTRRSINRINRAAMKMGRVFRRSALAFVALGGAAAFGAFRFLKAGADFEQAITNVAAVAGTTRDQIQALEDQAKSLGRTTQFTATQAANAMEILKRAGFSNNEVLSATPAVLNAAAASGMEMAEVANVMSNALKGMGLDASESTRVVDVLAKASTRTNSTMGSLGESLKNVASTARQLNIPFEDTVAAVALLQDVGLDASVAGSAMNTMLTKLAKPTAALERRMKKLGVRLKDAQGNMLPLPDVLENFSIAANKTGGNLEVVAFFADLVGLRGQKAATNLKDLFASGRFSELASELREAEGSAKAMAETRMDTLQGDFLKLKSAIEGIKIDIFENANSELREIVRLTTKWISENKNLIVQMASDPFGWVRELKRDLQDIVRTWVSFLRWTPPAVVARVFGLDLKDIAEFTRPSDEELAAMRKREDDERMDRQTFGDDDRGVSDEFRENFVPPMPVPLRMDQPPTFMEIQILDDTGKVQVTQTPDGAAVTQTPKGPKITGVQTSPTGTF